MGERIHREIQRKAQGRTATSGDLLFIEGGAGTYRTEEKGVHHVGVLSLFFLMVHMHGVCVPVGHCYLTSSYEL